MFCCPRRSLTISFKMLISLKSMRFSSSSMWLFLSTLTALWAPDSLCTHILTSPKAPASTQQRSITIVWKYCDSTQKLTRSENFTDTVIVSEFALSLADEHGCANATYTLTKHKNRWEKCSSAQQSKICCVDMGEVKGVALHQKYILFSIRWLF